MVKKYNKFGIHGDRKRTAESIVDAPIYLRPSKSEVGSDNTKSRLDYLNRNRKFMSASALKWVDILWESFRSQNGKLHGNQLNTLANLYSDALKASKNQVNSSSFSEQLNRIKNLHAKR